MLHRYSNLLSQLSSIVKALWSSITLFRYSPASSQSTCSVNCGLRLFTRHQNLHILTISMLVLQPRLNQHIMTLFFSRTMMVPSFHAGYKVSGLTFCSAGRKANDTLLDCRVGQVRAIFALPVELQHLHHNPGNEYAHLAYIELFTPFEASPEKYTHLCTQSHGATRTGRGRLLSSLCHMSLGVAT